MELSKFFAPEVMFFDSASYGLLPLTASEAIKRQIEAFSKGIVNIVDFDEVVENSLSHLAHAYGCNNTHFGAIGQLSTASSMVSHSIPIGSKVLMAKEDFTSVLFPFLEREERGEISVDLVPVEQLVELIDEKYALVAVSAVQSSSGYVIDLKALSGRAKSSGVRTFVDATQGAGWLPIEMDNFDVVAASAYKWLLSPRGSGFIHTTPEAQAWLRPTISSWYSGESIWDSIYGAPLRLASDGRRYQISPDWLSWVGAEHSLKLISEVGVDKIFAHNLALMEGLCYKIEEPFNNSSIISIGTSIKPEELREKGFRASLRNGRLRISIHLYNIHDEVEQLAELLNSRK
ncbi:MAG: aminotransferase class V-fold PLP-dependent enzyme [Actinomycetota bacterium]|nr:aminotransferase class V-fold PLP-dependent enzyme [Actinomycetota bacterium]